MYTVEYLQFGKTYLVYNSDNNLFQVTMHERVRFIGLVKNLLKVKENSIEIITYGNGLTVELDYFCAYRINSKTRFTEAVVDYSTNRLTCQTNFIQTKLFRCFKIFIVDSLGNEFKLDKSDSREDEVCFIEQLDIEGRIEPYFIPKDATYDTFRMTLTEESASVMELAAHLISTIQLETVHFT